MERSKDPVNPRNGTPAAPAPHHAPRQRPPVRAECRFYGPRRPSWSQTAEPPDSPDSQEAPHIWITPAPPSRSVTGTRRTPPRIPGSRPTARPTRGHGAVPNAAGRPHPRWVGLLSAAGGTPADRAVSDGSVTIGP